MACRVHNSAHWTIEGAETSQFENHVRAVTGLPLGPTGVSGHCAMLNLVGWIPDPAELEEASGEGIHVHVYGKSPAPGRKLGHITIFSASVAERDRKIRDVLDLVGDRALRAEGNRVLDLDEASGIRHPRA